MKTYIKMLVFFLITAIIPTGLQEAVYAAESYGYEILVSPTPAAIGSKVTLTIRLTDYTEKKSSIVGFQIDINDVDDVLHDSICMSLVTDKDNLISDTAKFQPNRDLVRHLYAKMNGSMAYSVADLLEVKFIIPETYEEAGTLSLPFRLLIQNKAGDQITYKDTININYVPESEIPDLPDPDVVSVDISWGSMDFVYTDGPWNSQNHKYEEGSWKDNGTGFVTVSNKGTVDTTSEFVFASEYSEIRGDFSDGIAAVVGSVNLSVGETKTVYLSLLGRPTKALDSTKIGMVTVKIGGE